MKVLFVSSSNSKLGIAPFIRSQGDSLIKNGVDLQYFTIEERGFRGYLKYISPLRKFIKKNNFDVVHAHYALSGWVTVLARPGVPVVVSYMGGDVYGDVDEQGNTTRRLNVFLSKLLQPWVDKIIVKSKNLEEQVYLKKKVHIIPNGVNFQRFKPMDQKECRERLCLPLQEKILLFLGDPSDPRKNIALLNEAVQLMNMKGVRITAPYPVNHDLVADYLNAADVFVLASRLEGSPNVVKEAMSCNCPIVATDVGDVKEVIKDTPGCFITSFDAAETAEKLKQALDFGKRTTGRKAVEHLDEHTIAEKIIKLYKGLK